MLFASPLHRKFNGLSVFGLLFLFNLSAGSAQSKFAGKEDLLSTPRQYTVVFNSLAPEIDGKLIDAVWKNVAWTEYFKDIEEQKKHL